MSSFSRCRTAFVTSDVSGSDEIVAVSAASYGFVGHSGGRGERARSCEETDASVADSFMLGSCRPEQRGIASVATTDEVRACLAHTDRRPSTVIAIASCSVSWIASPRSYLYSARNLTSLPGRLGRLVAARWAGAVPASTARRRERSTMAWQCSGSTNDELVNKLWKAGIIKSQRIKEAMRATDRKVGVGLECLNVHPHLAQA